MHTRNDASVGMALALYQAAFGAALLAGAAAAPVLERFSARVKDGFHHYFGNLPIPPQGPLIWLHAVSMGEANVISAIIEALKNCKNSSVIGFTTTHPDVIASVQKRKIADVAAYFPLDIAPGMAKAFNRWKPRLAVVSETDFWPVFSQTCKRRCVPLVLVNGRISEKIHAFYSSFHGLAEAVFEPFVLLAVQTDKDAERLLNIGVPPEKIKITGNVKADLQIPNSSMALEPIRAWIGGHKLIIFGSLHDSEFEMLMPIFKPLLETESSCKILLAPRKPSDALLWENRLNASYLNAVKKSALKADDKPAQNIRIAILDTMGELASVYKLAALAFVGGSFDAKIGGHNPLEVLNCGVPLIMGPYTRNFADLTDELTSSNAMERPENAEELLKTLTNLLHHPERVEQLTQTSEKILKRHKGALKKTLQLLMPLLPAKETSE